LISAVGNQTQIIPLSTNSINAVGKIICFVQHFLNDFDVIFVTGKMGC